ncbi:hypothetical protein GCM10023083_46630 [Streptomyces phyllanthi]
MLAAAVSPSTHRQRLRSQRSKVWKRSGLDHDGHQIAARRSVGGTYVPLAEALSGVVLLIQEKAPVVVRERLPAEDVGEAVGGSVGGEPEEIAVP